MTDSTIKNDTADPVLKYIMDQSLRLHPAQDKLIKVRVIFSLPYVKHSVIIHTFSLLVEGDHRV